MNGSRRIAWFRGVAIVFGIGALLGLFGIALVVGWFEGGERRIHRVHDIGFGVLIWIAFVVPLFGMAIRPDLAGGLLQQMVWGGGGAAIGAVMAGDESGLFLLGIAVVVAAILFAIHPTRADFVPLRRGWSPPLGVFTFLGAIPLVAYALTMARFQREGFALDPHVEQGHWTSMAGMALAIVLTGALASLPSVSRRVTAWSAGLGLAVFGLASMVFGDGISGAGAAQGLWGTMAVVGGLLFVAAAEGEVRRAATPR